MSKNKCSRVQIWPHQELHYFHILLLSTDAGDLCSLPDYMFADTTHSRAHYSHWLLILLENAAKYLWNQENMYRIISMVCK